MNDTPFFDRLFSLPNGTYSVWYQNRRYLMRKESLLGERLIKLYARELGGKDIVSANYYPSIKKGILKPCEISDAKVIAFVLHLEILH